MTRSDRDRLLSGDPEPLGLRLSVALSELLASGFRVWDVHESTDGRYEVLMDREINAEMAQRLASANGLQIFDDFDENDRQRGYGLLCPETGHHVNGPVSDAGGHS